MAVVTCPNCGQSVDWTPEQRWKPFCSERCRLIDLGEWITGNHRIPDKPVYDDDELI